MQYIKLRYQTDEVDLFSDEDMDGNVQPISREDYERLLAYICPGLGDAGDRIFGTI